MQTKNTQRALAIDWGRNTWGFAIGQSHDFIQPLKALKVKQGSVNPDDIKKLIQEWQPVIIILGHPLQKDKSALSITAQVERCQKWLIQSTHLPVILHDETKTTKKAKEIIFNKEGYKGLKQKEKLDSLAAALILESWYLKNLHTDA